ncbi:MAG: biosynthetic-type acetolactate synthase large subunit, partial [Spirochaetota bacterium]
VKKGKSTGARRLVKGLEAAGAEIIFAYPGGANLPIYEALARSGIKTILARHEQGAAHMADGYARAGGRPGFCMATSGPGATNLVTGIATAYMDSSPVIAITGQVSRNMIGNDAFQEVDITGITIPITKHNYLIQQPEDILPALEEAIYLATTGRKGPVLLDITKDSQQAELSIENEVRKPLEGYAPTVKGHAGQIKRAATLIAEAKKPVVIAGGGVALSDAFASFAAFVEKLQIPVVHSLMGKAAFDNRQSLNFGLFGYHGRWAANKAVSEADLIIAVGTRFGDRSTGPLASFAPEARIVHIDIDPAEIGKNVSTYLPIVGDVADVLPRLTALVAGCGPREWSSQLADAAREHPLTTGDGRFCTPLILKTLQDYHPDPILVTDVGRHQIFACLHFPVSGGRNFISSGGLGTMGFGLPAAIGAKLAKPDRDVLLISGDGSFIMNIQELACAGALGTELTAVVIHDHRLGMISQLQDAFYGSRFDISPIPGSVNYAAAAEAFGCHGLRVTDLTGLKAALEHAKTLPGLKVIECMVDNEEHVYPMVTGGKLTDLVEGGAE